MSGRYVVVFNPVEQERLCAVTVFVNTVKVRVLTETGQTLPVQLSGQWSSASQMSAEVFEVSEAREGAAVDGGPLSPWYKVNGNFKQLQMHRAFFGPDREPMKSNK